MDLVSTKLFVALIFGFWRFFWGTLPVKLDKWIRKWEDATTDSKTFINAKRHQQVTCYLALTQSFGGGVLFATCFLHMIKELFLSVEEVKSYWNVQSEYPISQFVIAIGFFSVYFLEEFTHWAVNSKAKKKKWNGKCSKNVKPFERSGSSSARSSKPLTVTPVNKVATIEEWSLNKKNKELIDFEYDYDVFKTPIKEANLNQSQENKEKPFSRTQSSKSRNSLKENLDKANLEAIEDEGLTVEEQDAIKNREQMMRCILTIAALSLHSFLEGLSIGIQKFQYEVWYLFIAVSIHSASILFCLGVELVIAQTRVKFIIIHMAALASASPIGILLGLLLTAKTSIKQSTMSVSSVILEGFSAGAILYITFFEVLNREKERRVFRLKRALFILGGFTLMALLQIGESRWRNQETLINKDAANVTVL